MPVAIMKDFKLLNLYPEHCTLLYARDPGKFTKAANPGESLSEKFEPERVGQVIAWTAVEPHSPLSFASDSPEAIVRDLVQLVFAGGRLASRYEEGTAQTIAGCKKSTHTTKMRWKN